MIHLNDIGTTFRLKIVESNTTTALDISGATDLRIKFEKPDRTTVTQLAEFTTDGIDGYIEYVTVDGDLDIEGKWRVQGIISNTVFTNSSQIRRFKVVGNI